MTEPVLLQLGQMVHGYHAQKYAAPAAPVSLGRSVARSLVDDKAGLVADATESALERAARASQARLDTPQRLLAPGQNFIGARLERSDGVLGGLYRGFYRLRGHDTIGHHTPDELRQMDAAYSRQARAGEKARTTFNSQADQELLDDPHGFVDTYSGSGPRAAAGDGAGGGGGASPDARGGGESGPRRGPGWGTALTLGAAVPAVGASAWALGRHQEQERSDRDRWLGAGAGFAAGLAAPNIARNVHGYLGRLGGQAPAANPSAYGGYGV